MKPYDRTVEFTSLAMLFFLIFAIPNDIFAQSLENVVLEKYGNQTKLVIEKQYQSSETKKADIIDEIITKLRLSEEAIESANLIEMDKPTGPLLDFFKTEVNIKDCTSSVKIRFETVIDTANRTEIVKLVNENDLVEPEEVDRSMILSNEIPQDSLIRVIVDDSETKFQMMICGERTNKILPTTNEDEILSFIQDETSLSESEIRSVWTYVVPEEEGPMYTRQKNASEIQQEAEQTISASEKQMARAEEGIMSATQGGGGCLIATATYGSELAPQVQQLRELRDEKLLKTEVGTSFMNGFNQLYYSFSPLIADQERQNPAFKEIVKLSITPMIYSLSLLNHAELDSDANLLAYGISIIMLNISMYFLIPIVGLVYVRRRLCGNHQTKSRMS